MIMDVEIKSSIHFIANYYLKISFFLMGCRCQIHQYKPQLEIGIVSK